MQTDRAVVLLSNCTGTALSISELTRKTPGNHEKTMELIKELKDSSLLFSKVSGETRRGRPKQLLRTSKLGQQFVEEYRRLIALPLHCSDNDIKKALHQADLAQRVVDQNISPYARFQEINELARNIANTAQISKNTR